MDEKNRTTKRGRVTKKTNLFSSRIAKKKISFLKERMDEKIRPLRGASNKENKPFFIKNEWTEKPS